ncbi:terminase small subunit [Desulfoferula mesophila]|uniref:Terminase n=1 Tax=Desulfoferula mesophila TaxID=3058419 RepID=A0AAU9EG12_9BACT|nr:terminase [Desulfoferula mesophilus]
MYDLTPKQERFVDEYMVDLNASQAALRAGLKSPAYGRELVTKTYVLKAIQKAKAKRCERTGVTADQVVAELAAVGFARLTDVCSWGPEGVTLLTSEELGDKGKAGVGKVKTSKVGEVETVEISMGSPVKVKALELLAKHTGVIGADIEVNVNNSIEEALKLIEERQAKLGVVG